MKRISIILTMCSLVIALVSIAAAPMASGTATLISAVFVEGKGVVFTFQVDGKFSKSDLNGGIQVEGGGNYRLDCVKAGDSTVKCTAPKAVAGSNVVITWGGSAFWTHAPAMPAPKAEYCYSIYDWNEDPNTEWVNYGTYCQDDPAMYGDLIMWENPEWGDSPYLFLPESPEIVSCAAAKRYGDAYYFPLCGF
jgi:hypothetical protein